MAKFVDYLKNIFWVLLILQFLPVFIKSFKNNYSDYLENKTKVGVITIKNIIDNSDHYSRDLKKFFEDKSIKAIVLKIDSPGGAAGSSQTIYNEIKHYKKIYTSKYVIAWIENIAASGGYYIATAADYIIASPGAFIGSIGSYIAHTNLKNFIENYKVKYDVIKSGTYKAMGSMFLELTEEQRKLLQSVTTDVHQQFIRDVLQQRPNLGDQSQWAQAQIFTGEQALKLKLIDAVGSPATVEDALKNNAHLEGKIDWIKPAKKSSLLAKLVEEDDDNNSYLNMVISNICSIVENRYSQAIVRT